MNENDLKNILEVCEALKNKFKNLNLNEDAPMPQVDGVTDRECEVKTNLDLPDAEEWLPAMRMTERWGISSSDPNEKPMERKQIERVFSNIEGNTWKEKLTNISNFMKECTEVDSENCAATTADKALSYLVMLDCLATAVSDYSTSAGGFLFEAILSAAFGGGSKQIEAGVGSETAIVDLIQVQGESRTYFSAKFLSAQDLGSGVIAKGSAENLLIDLVFTGQPMKFIVGVKGDVGAPTKAGVTRAARDQAFNLNFYEFTVGLKNDTTWRAWFWSDFVKSNNLGGNKIYIVPLTGKNAEVQNDENLKILKKAYKNNIQILNDTKLSGNSKSAASGKRIQQAAFKAAGAQESPSEPIAGEEAEGQDQEVLPMDLTLELENNTFLIFNPKNETVKSSSNLYSHAVAFRGADYLAEADGQADTAINWSRALALHNSHKDDPTIQYDWYDYKKKGKAGMPSISGAGYRFSGGHLGSTGLARSVKGFGKISDEIKVSLRIPSISDIRRGGIGKIENLENIIKPMFQYMTLLSKNFNVAFFEGSKLGCRIGALEDAKVNLESLSTTVQTALKQAKSTAGADEEAIQENKKGVEITRSIVLEIIREEVEIILNEIID